MATNAFEMLNPVDKLVVNIALLRLATESPERPSEHGLGHKDTAERTISLKDERSISHHLAFICAYSDDKGHVMAACIEENPGIQRLIIRFASNSGEHENVMVALGDIALILQNEATRINRDTNKSDLLRAVVKLNFKRILSRLRSCHANLPSTVGGKPSLVARLKVAKRLLHASKHAPHIKKCLDDLQDLEVQLDSLENTRKPNAQSTDSQIILSCIVQNIYRFLKLHGPKLHYIPPHPQDWTGDSTKSLLHRMEKLAQYVEASDELLRAARRYSVFFHITPFFVNRQNISKHQFSNGFSVNLVPLRTLRRLSQFRKENEQQTLSRLKNSLQKVSRVHAEIQILLYYEEQNDCLRPRVIGSNKSACYLCHLFFQLHGEYDVPSSHGKLYAAWKWPASAKTNITPTVDMGHLLSAFSAAVVQKLNGCLQEGQKKSQDVLESRINLPVMTPSVFSLTSNSTIKASQRSHNPALAVPSATESKDVITMDKDMISESSGSSSSISLDDFDGESLPDADNPTGSSSRGRSPSELSHHIVHSSESLIDTSLDKKGKVDVASTAEVRPEPIVHTRPQSRKRAERHDSKGDDSWLPEMNARHTSALDEEEDVVDFPGPVLPEQCVPMAASPVLLQRGIPSMHSFDTQDRILRVWTPKLHLNLEFVTENVASNSDVRFSMSTTEKKCLQLEIRWLDSVRDLENGTVIEVGDLDSEQAMPKGILFSQAGLMVVRQNTLIQMRAINSDGSC